MFHTLEEVSDSFLIRTDGIKLNTIAAVWQSMVIIIICISELEI